MAQTTILGLSLPDWINLVISLLIVPIGYGIGALIAEVLLRWIARRTSPQVGEAISKAFGPSLRWLVAILVLSFATKRLTFLSPELKATLADRPFRVGDRIEIQGVGTWGDVVEIGLRTTEIRTRDNRMVIVPNSLIGKNQVF